MLNFSEAYILHVNDRILLNESDAVQLTNVQNGITGEKIFLEFFDGLKAVAMIHGLRLDIKGEVQYDFLFIQEGEVYHYEIKNYQGQLEERDGLVKNQHGYIYKNIFQQFDRANVLLEQILNEYRVESYIVFINPSCSIKTDRRDVLEYQDLKQRVEFHQAKKSTSHDFELAKLLKSHHLHRSKYERILYYDFDQLLPGVKCPECMRFFEDCYGGRDYVKCSYCHHKMRKQALIFETIKQVELLKNDYYTALEISKWSGISKRTIHKVLNHYCDSFGSNRATRYVLRDEFRPKIFNTIK